jgi:hypothetical protein
MTCDQAEHLADRAIRKARWPIGNLMTIALIGIFLAVTVLAFMFGGGSGGHSGVRLKKTKGKRNEVTAMIPWWLQDLQTFALIAIPAVGACLAWQQVQIARVKLQHDLYDRRYRVFEATRKLLAETLVHRVHETYHMSEILFGIDAV